MTPLDAGPPPATGQAERLAVAQAEIAALSAQVEALEHSPSRRALAPARQAFKAMRRLVSPHGTAASVTEAWPGRASRGVALVIDHSWPEPDRDSGSVDIVNLMRALDRLGFHAILAASRQHAGEQPARDRLVAAGLRCLHPADATSVEQFIARRGPAIALGVMCRAFCGGEFLEPLQRHARQARLVFNSVDLNFLREERRAEFLDDDDLRAKARRAKEREELVIRNSDATLVVSEAERQLLAETMPKTGFEQRAGIGFIGGFAHAPNVDAMRHFLAKIWPLVRQALPGCGFSIVGADAPADLADNANGVRILGHKADIEPWFDSLRLTVAPLRYGAGAKGKVASSLANGVPCVVTSVAAEGMSLLDQDGVLVRDAPADFAAAIASVYTDAGRWRQLSQAGLAYAERTLSPVAWQSRLEAVVWRLGL